MLYPCARRLIVTGCAIATLRHMDEAFAYSSQQAECRQPREYHYAPNVTANPQPTRRYWDYGNHHCPSHHLNKAKVSARQGTLLTTILLNELGFTRDL